MIYAQPSSELNSNFTFSKFVVGPCNRMPHAVAVAAAERPGETYNPLYIHGASGLGKTHLLQAICSHILQQNSTKHIEYLPCDAFVNTFIAAVEKNQLPAFRRRFRSLDTLIIDDIQFLANKERTPEEFFHTFNSLFNKGHQIIISGDRSPSEIPTLHHRLLSRFNWGMVARMESPTYETRVAILRRKAKTYQMAIPDEVIHFIANHAIQSIREIEGCMVKIMGLGHLTGRSLSLNLAREMFAQNPYAIEESSSEQRAKVTMESIISEISHQYSVKLAELQSKRRSRFVAFPRQICMHLARKLTGHSLKEIGGFLGGRDHTTVLYADGKIARLRTVDIELNDTLDRISNKLRLG